MKIKYLYSTTIILAFLLCGCEKGFLDTRFDTAATDETIATSRGTLFGFANAFYIPLSSAIGFNSLDENFFEAATDDGQQTRSAAGNVLVFNQGTLSESNPSAEAIRLSSFYEGIRAANFFLDYSQNWEDILKMNRDTETDVISYNKDRLFVAAYRAEAHIARAFYYSELIKRYGGVPIVTKTYNPDKNESLPKSSYEEVVNYIISEIDTYKKDLVVNWKTNGYSDQDGRFSLGSALAIKSRVLLYAASPLHNSGNDISKWAKAAEAARDVMTTSGLNYALHTGGYGNYFLGNNSLTSTETILAIRRAAGNDLESANYPIGTAGGRSGVTPTHNLVAAYEYNGPAIPADPYANRDPRLAATVVTNGSTWNDRVIDQSAGAKDDMNRDNASLTGYYLKKFLDPNLNLSNGATAQHHWIAFRYAEILLNYAEAMNEAFGAEALPAGYPSTAREALNLVRNRIGVGMSPILAGDVPSGLNFRNAVKHERRIELAFENHRYWDLLRWKDAETALNQPVKGVRITKNTNNTFNYEVINAGNRVFKAPVMYLLPFPRVEIVRSNGVLVQNPGY